MTLLSRFPLEIIEHINSYLTHEDRFELIRVNQTWFRIFTVLLYRTITIESQQQFKQLMHIFEESQRTCDLVPIGHLVYELNLMLEELEESELRKIQKLCPFLHSVHVDWRIWNLLAFQESESISNNLEPRNFHSRQTLPAYTIEFIANYGSCKLSSLTLDLYNFESINSRDILRYTPNLKNLRLMGISQYINISIYYVEAIHQLCPLLESLELEGCMAEATSPSDINNDILPSIIQTMHQPSVRMKSFRLKSQYGADRCQDWLPYLDIKYPKLISVDFTHAGNGKDVAVSCCSSVYHQFLLRCSQLEHLCWNNTAPDFKFFQALDASKYQKLKTLNVYDNVYISSLLSSAMFDSQNNILCNLTSLTFGPVPRGLTPQQMIDLISKSCPRLVHLVLREPRCDLINPLKIDKILDAFPHLFSLELDRIALRVSFDRIKQRDDRVQSPHRLQSLAMRHCSSFDGVFDHISFRCPDLSYLSLFAYTQRDRRFKVQIHMPYQKFRKVELHGLRTESYDVERRIRFFSIKQLQTEHYKNSSKEVTWYYMKQFDVRNYSIGRDTAYRCMEMAKELVSLNSSEASFLSTLTEKSLSWNELEDRKKEYLDNEKSDMVKEWRSNDICDAGYVDFTCHSVDRFYINKKKVVFSS